MDPSRQSVSQLSVDVSHDSEVKLDATIQICHLYPFVFCIIVIPKVQHLISITHVYAAQGYHQMGAIALSASITNPMSSLFVTFTRHGHTRLTTCSTFNHLYLADAIRCSHIRYGKNTEQVRESGDEVIQPWIHTVSKIEDFQKVGRSGVAYQEIYGGGDMYAPQNVPRS